MGDYVVRVTAEQGKVRALAARTTELVEQARGRHRTLPTATAALGRALTAGVLVGMTLKERQTLTLRIVGSGPIGWILVCADAAGNVRGYVRNPLVDLPPTPEGKLDVAGAVGHEGHLAMSYDLGLKEPYTGVARLVSGEIARDLTFYFASSEQVPSSVGLGVMVGREGVVRAAGGFLVQVLPGVGEEVIRGLETAVGGIGSISAAIEDGASPEQILGTLLRGLEPRGQETRDVAFRCTCSREKVADVLAAMGPEELAQFAASATEAEVRCKFCNEGYTFAPGEIERLLASFRQPS